MVSGGGKVLSGAVDEHLDHPNARADTLGADAPAPQATRDRRRALGKDSLGRVGRNGFDRVRPFLLRRRCHDRAPEALPAPALGPQTKCKLRAFGCRGQMNVTLTVT